MSLFLNLVIGLSIHAQICDLELGPLSKIIADRLIVFSDVDDVKFVINFDYPNNSEDYIHRIGRTGRSSKTGTSYAFFTQENSRQARDLVNVLKEANQVVSPELEGMASRGGGGGGGYRGFNNRFGTFKGGFGGGRENRFGGARKSFGGDRRGGSSFGSSDAQRTHKKFSDYS